MSKLDFNHPFERVLSVSIEDIAFTLRGYTAVSWAEFVLNPRRLRGSDFLMRWSQGVWSEERIVQAVNETKDYFALPYGPSGTAPDHDVREFELYFERLEKAGLGQLKRPDLLIFQKRNQIEVEKIVGQLGGVQELPFIPEKDSGLRNLLSKAVIAVECENSLWKAKVMPDYGAELKPQRRLGGQLGLKKSAVLPTVIIKEEDRAPLNRWQQQNNIPIHIWHVFFDMSFGLALNSAEALVDSGKILPTEQVFQAPGGATTRKAIYKFYYHYAYLLGEAEEEPSLIPDYVMDKNGHILPYVRFKGGRLKFSADAVAVLNNLVIGRN